LHSPVLIGASGGSGTRALRDALAAAQPASDAGARSTPSKPAPSPKPPHPRSPGSAIA